MKNFLILFLLVGLFSSCLEEFDNTTSTTIDDDPNIKVETTVTGMVVDENGEALAFAPVELDEYIAYTNANGAFVFKDVIIDKNGSQLSSEVDGYFFGSSLIYPKSGRIHSTRITLLEKTNPIIISSSVASNVGIPNSFNDLAQLVFEANSFVTVENVPYNGEVEIYVRYLDPTEAATAQTMPGALIAQNSAGQEGALTSYGMIGVEMNTPQGDKILMAENSKTEFLLPIPISLIDQAPETIALWFFDEEKGLWIEEGEAVKTGSVYSGEVSHFTFWNCDVFGSSTFVTGRVINDAGEALQNLKVELKIQSNGSTSFEYTDSDGFYSGRVPRDEVFDRLIYSHCDVLLEDAIGAFSMDVVSLNDVILNNEDTTQLLTMTVSGRLFDCAGNILTDARIDVLKEGGILQYERTDDEGFFEFEIEENCSMNELSFFGYDRTNYMTTDTINFAFQPFLNVGEINTCVDFYPQYARMDLEFWYIDAMPNVDFEINNFEINATSGTGPGVLHLQLDNYNGIGEYTTGVSGTYSNIVTGWCTADSITFETTRINIIADTGKYIEGTFMPQEWTIHNDNPIDCLGPDEVPFLGGFFIVEY